MNLGACLPTELLAMLKHGAMLVVCGMDNSQYVASRAADFSSVQTAHISYTPFPSLFSLGKETIPFVFSFQTGPAALKMACLSLPFSALGAPRGD